MKGPISRGGIAQIYITLRHDLSGPEKSSLACTLRRRRSSTVHGSQPPSAAIRKRDHWRPACGLTVGRRKWKGFGAPEDGGGHATDHILGCIMRSKAKLCARRDIHQRKLDKGAGSKTTDLTHAAQTVLTFFGCPTGSS
jgi:hypothetical protein